MPPRGGNLQQNWGLTWDRRCALHGLASSFACLVDWGSRWNRRNGCAEDRAHYWFSRIPRHARVHARTHRCARDQSFHVWSGSVFEHPELADHFLNGVGFVTIYVLIFGRTRWWLAIPYALGIATIFMISPATTSTGIGYFGLDSGIGFMITVYLAHIAFAAGFGTGASHGPAMPETLWHYHLAHSQEIEADEELARPRSPQTR